MIEALQSPMNSTYRIGLLTFGTCALGITLSPACRVCVFAEVSFTPAIMEQSENKLWRTGMTGEVSIYWFIARGTVDENVVVKGQEKTNSNSLVLDRAKRKLVFIGNDQPDEEEQFWKTYGLTGEEAQRICITRLEEESDESYFSRCTVFLDDEEGGDVREIRCNRVTCRIGIKACLSDSTPFVAVLQPSHPFKRMRRAPVT